MRKNNELWDAVEKLELDLEQAKRSLLQNNGWRNTSRTPGSYWMWTKELAIGTVYVDEKVALRIQSDLDGGYYSDMEKSKE